MSIAPAPLAQPQFPPLLTGRPVGARLDPFEKAVALAATEGCEPGLVCYAEDEAAMRAAITLAPESALAQAIAAVYAVELGTADALGALAPPEVAVQFDWPDVLKVNGARCGGFRAAASTADPEAEPDWLVVGVEVPLHPAPGHEPGERPDETTLAAEGCVEITAPALIESWSRHTLVWIHRLLDEGFRPLHEAWRGRCDRIGETVERPAAGTFVGLDERGGMLLRTGEGTRLVPMTEMLVRL